MLFNRFASQVVLIPAGTGEHVIPEIGVACHSPEEMDHTTHAPTQYFAAGLIHVFEGLCNLPNLLN